MRVEFSGVIFAVVIALALSSLVMAQEADSQEEAERTTEQQPTALQQTNSRVIEEVVVTAQRREEIAQKVGVTMTVLGGDEMDKMRIHNVTSISGHAPNVEIKEVLGNANPVVTIRGVGLADFNANNSSPSAIYFDEVYVVSPIMAGFQMFDTQRVEVLKGPQGTLYGRNTTGGAVNFIPNRPTHDFGGHFTLGYGSWNTAEAEFVINGGLSDKVAGRLSARSVQGDGGPWFNRFDGTDFGAPESFAARGQLQWDPSDAVSVLFSLHYGRDRGDGIGYQHIGIVDPDTYDLCPEYVLGGTNTYRCIDYFGYQDPDKGDLSQGEYNFSFKNDFESLGGMIRLDWETDAATLTSITGYVGFDRWNTEDSDSGPMVGIDVTYYGEITQFSQELRLASNTDSSVSWIAGLYYSTDERIGDPNQHIALDDWLLSRVSSAWDQQTTAAAVFGHLDWSLSTAFNLWLGLRYTNESTDFKAVSADLNPWGTSCFLDPLCDPGFVGPFILATTDDSIDDSDVSGGVGFEWYASDDWMIYGGIKKGFKSGGFSGTFTTASELYAPYGPETLYSYDLGVKSTLADGRAQFNATAFYYDYQDMQVYTTIGLGGIPQSVLANASDARIAGLEADLWWRAAAGLDIKFGIGYLDTEYVNFESIGEDYSGNKLSNAPEMSYTVALSYQGNVSSTTTAGFSLDYSWSDTVYREVTNHPWLTTDPYGLLGARAFVEFGRYEFAVWGRNLTDERYTMEGFDLGDFGLLWNIPGLLRSYGATFTVRF